MDSHGALAFHPQRLPDVTPWQPRMLCEPSDLAVLNACSIRRAPFHGSIDGLPVEIDLSPTYVIEPLTANHDWFEVSCSWGDAHARATLACETVRRLLDRLQPGLSDDPPGEPTLSMLLELAFASLLEKIETATGMSLRIRSCHRASCDFAPDPSWRRLLFHGVLNGAPFELGLELDGPALEYFVKLLQQAAPAPLPLAKTIVPVVAVLCAGAVRLPLRTLQDLHHGDVLLPDEFPFERGEAALTFGHRYRAIARLDETGAYVRSMLQHHNPVQEINAMEGKTAPGAVETDSLGDLEIQLTFELGRQTVELEQLRTIAPGYVFALGRSPNDPVDIVANGRRIGRGEIVRVGDGLGVRLIRLFDHG
ncbi:type III secretion system cytoplasmic ring protein SctQ [Bradyrhizobium sp. WSM 1738]|uniref:type III secretion system cytoplasmic ring protein SctQ n=1 Tax=Bradyrhizobium hereditatis TaxID=2821405 RepID=UPI001CE2F985|nr:type III secretion system cytoplasmic ring protein SctQ [Bradyrhizobium hereditatis]MCA6116458.1 type III secretion system cytoplasmic ring protein SctQ [Bradyrhizobium hereditatis]